MEAESKKIIIMRELPKNVIQRRKEYKDLTSKLKVDNINFRWELLEGVSFTYQGVRRTIVGKKQREEFSSKYKNGEDINKNKDKKTVMDTRVQV